MKIRVDERVDKSYNNKGSKKLNEIYPHFEILEKLKKESSIKDGGSTFLKECNYICRSPFNHMEGEPREALDKFYNSKYWFCGELSYTKYYKLKHRDVDALFPVLLHKLNTPANISPHILYIGEELMLLILNYFNAEEFFAFASCSRFTYAIILGFLHMKFIHQFEKFPNRASANNIFRLHSMVVRSNAQSFTQLHDHLLFCIINNIVGPLNGIIGKVIKMFEKVCLLANAKYEKEPTETTNAKPKLEMMLSKFLSRGYRGRPHGKKALPVACENNCLEIVDILLTNGVEITVSDVNSDGLNVLELAILHKNVEMISALLDYTKSLDVFINGEINSGAETDRRYMDKTYNKFKGDILSRLMKGCKQAYPEGRLFFHFISTDDIPTLTRLLRFYQSLNIELPTKSFNPLLSKAIKMNANQFGKYIMTNLTPNLNNLEFEEKTPLMWACLTENTEFFKLLIKCKSCNINITNRKGKSALYYAIRGNNSEFCKQLLNHRPAADVSITTYRHNNLLHLSIKRGLDRDTLSILIPLFPHWIFEQMNSSGITPLFLARSSTDKTLLNYLTSQFDKIDEENYVKIHMTKKKKKLSKEENKIFSPDLLKLERKLNKKIKVKYPYGFTELTKNMVKDKIIKRRWSFSGYKESAKILLDSKPWESKFRKVNNEIEPGQIYWLEKHDYDYIPATEAAVLDSDKLWRLCILTIMKRQKTKRDSGLFAHITANNRKRGTLAKSAFLFLAKYEVHPTPIHSDHKFLDNSLIYNKFELKRDIQLNRRMLFLKNRLMNEGVKAQSKLEKLQKLENTYDRLMYGNVLLKNNIRDLLFKLHMATELVQIINTLFLKDFDAFAFIYPLIRKFYEESTCEMNFEVDNKFEDHIIVEERANVPGMSQYIPEKVVVPLKPIQNDFYMRLMGAFTKKVTKPVEHLTFKPKSYTKSRSKIIPLQHKKQLKVGATKEIDNKNVSKQESTEKEVTEKTLKANNSMEDLYDTFRNWSQPDSYAKTPRRTPPRTSRALEGKAADIGKDSKALPRSESPKVDKFLNRNSGGDFGQVCKEIKIIDSSLERKEIQTQTMSRISRSKSSKSHKLTLQKSKSPKSSKKLALNKFITKLSKDKAHNSVFDNTEKDSNIKNNEIAILKRLKLSTDMNKVQKSPLLLHSDQEEREVTKKTFSTNELNYNFSGEEDSEEDGNNNIPQNEEKRERKSSRSSFSSERSESPRDKIGREAKTLINLDLVQIHEDIKNEEDHLSPQNIIKTVLRPPTHPLLPKCLIERKTGDISPIRFGRSGNDESRITKYQIVDLANQMFKENKRMSPSAMSRNGRKQITSEPTSPSMFYNTYSSTWTRGLSTRQTPNLSKYDIKSTPTHTSCGKKEKEEKQFILASNDTTKNVENLQNRRERPPRHLCKLPEVERQRSLKGWDKLNLSKKTYPMQHRKGVLENYSKDKLRDLGESSPRSGNGQRIINELLLHSPPNVRSRFINNLRQHQHTNNHHNQLPSHNQSSFPHIKQNTNIRKYNITSLSSNPAKNRPSKKLVCRSISPTPFENYKRNQIEVLNRRNQIIESNNSEYRVEGKISIKMTIENNSLSPIYHPDPKSLTIPISEKIADGSKNIKRKIGSKLERVDDESDMGNKGSNFWKTSTNSYKDNSVLYSTPQNYYSRPPSKPDFETFLEHKILIDDKNLQDDGSIIKISKIKLNDHTNKRKYSSVTPPNNTKNIDQENLFYTKSSRKNAAEKRKKEMKLEFTDESPDSKSRKDYYKKRFGSWSYIQNTQPNIDIQVTPISEAKCHKTKKHEDINIPIYFPRKDESPNDKSRTTTIPTAIVPSITNNLKLETDRITEYMDLEDVEKVSKAQNPNERHSLNRSSSTNSNIVSNVMFLADLRPRMSSSPSDFKDYSTYTNNKLIHKMRKSINTRKKTQVTRQLSILLNKKDLDCDDIQQIESEIDRKLIRMNTLEKIRENLYITPMYQKFEANKDKEEN